MKHPNNKKYQLDFAHTLTVLFTLAVLIYHHDTYTFSVFPTFLTTGNVTQTLVVGGFIFLSGYKLALSNKPHSSLEFWKRRFFRIYPLYLIAVIAFSILIHPGTTLDRFLLHIFMAQELFPGLVVGRFLTLYFVSLLMLFYAVFFSTVKYIRYPIQYLTVHAAIFLGTLLLHRVRPFGITLFDPEFFKYYPYFLGGILFARAVRRPMSLRIPASFHSVPKIISFLSFSTYPVFLFHRPFWQLIVNLHVSSPLLNWILIVPVGIPTLFLLSFFIQKKANTFAAKHVSM